MSQKWISSVLFLGLFSNTFAYETTTDKNAPEEKIVITKFKKKREWDRRSDPVNIFQDTSITSNVNAISAKNYAENRPWSDSYWPTYQGGIAYRWQTRETPFNINLSAKDYKNMSEEEIALLSPAEKYDLYMGRYDVPTFKSEKMRSSPTTATWEGLCHGWAPAALLFKEPNPVTLKNSDGKQIRFSASDVKALLIYYTANVSSIEMGIKTLFAGNRCNSENSSNCLNTNAGAFYLIITNMMAKKIPMVADVDRGIQVWNQPIAGYEITRMVRSSSISRYAARGTVKQLEVTMNMFYGQEAFQSLNPGNNIIVKVEYQFTLELDANDKVIGGEWISDKRPDFIWTLGMPKFTEQYYGKIKLIHQSSLGPILPGPGVVNLPGPGVNNLPNSGTTNFPTTGRVTLNGISVGETVLEKFDSFSMGVVKSISNEGKFYLTGGDSGDGTWYDISYLEKLVKTNNGMTAGDMALEKFNQFSAGKVKAISSSGYVLLTGTNDGVEVWYSNSYIEKLISSYSGIKVGDIVVEKFENQSTGSVTYISENGYFYLTGGDSGNGIWYHSSYISLNN